MGVDNRTARHVKRGTEPEPPDHAEVQMSATCTITPCGMHALSGGGVRPKRSSDHLRPGHRSPRSPNIDFPVYGRGSDTFNSGCTMSTPFTCYRAQLSVSSPDDFKHCGFNFHGLVSSNPSISNSNVGAHIRLTPRRPPDQNTICGRMARDRLSTRDLGPSAMVSVRQSTIQNDTRIATCPDNQTNIKDSLLAFVWLTGLVASPSAV